MMVAGSLVMGLYWFVMDVSKTQEEKTLELKAKAAKERGVVQGKSR